MAKTNTVAKQEQNADFRTALAIEAVEQHKEQARLALNAEHNAAIIAAREDTARRIMSDSAVINLIDPASEVFIPATDKDGKPKGDRDKVRKPGSIERELPHLTHEQTLTILRQHDRVSFTVASACASAWADWVSNTAHVQSIAADLKAWKALKGSLEASIVPVDAVEAFAFPQQWQDYATALRSYLTVGGDPMALIYRNADEAECVRTRYWLKQEAKRLDRSVKPEKAERISESLSNLATRALGGEDGKGEIVSPADIQVDTATAKLLLDVAEANIGTFACRERLQAENVEETLRRLMVQNGKDTIRNMLESIANAYPDIV